MSVAPTIPGVQQYSQPIRDIVLIQAGKNGSDGAHGEPLEVQSLRPTLVDVEDQVLESGTTQGDQRIAAYSAKPKRSAWANARETPSDTNNG